MKIPSPFLWKWSNSFNPHHFFFSVKQLHKGLAQLSSDFPKTCMGQAMQLLSWMLGTYGDAYLASLKQRWTGVMSFSASKEDENKISNEQIGKGELTVV